MPPHPNGSGRLIPYMFEPTTQGPILEFMRANGGPLFLKEIADGVGMPLPHVDRALRRLVEKGVLTRYKLPAQRPGYRRALKRSIPGGATHLLWLYSLAEAGE